jgi:hypothetical protein
MNTNSPTSQNTSFNSDLTDGREKGHWETRYSDKIAQQAIKWERKYLIILFFSVLAISIFLGLSFKRCLGFLNINCELTEFKIYCFAFLGGMLGGIVFSMKWLYHSVAKNTWNIDRRLWRILTPLLSSVVALIIVMLLNSDILKSNNSHFSIYKSFAVGFLAGYFSDSAIGKLTEIAQVLFGSSSTKGK